MQSETVILYPFPGIGHLVSMVELGKLIQTRHPSLSVIILITPALFETGSIDNTVSSSITFHHLPTIAIPPDLSSEHLDIAFGLPELYNPIVHNTLVSISEKSTIKAVILDLFTNAAFHVSKSLNLPTYYFYTGSASLLCTFLYLPTIHNTTSKSIKDLDTYFDFPGGPPIHSSDIPSGFTDKGSNSYANFIKTSINMTNSSGIIVNSFTGFEETAVDTLRDGKCFPGGPTPPVYLIGPVIVSVNQVDPNEDTTFKWLYSQPSKSVVFLCFGSSGVFKKEQLKEIAIGLERSGQRFLWVVRDPPRDDGNESNSGANEPCLNDILPEGFLTRTRDKGLVVKNWAPQPAILNHDSVGGFVSHCGWNSILESVIAGVPMVAWPLYAEQKLNKVHMIQVMKVALTLNMSSDGFVTADAVQESVRALMEGKEGRVVREQVLEASRRAKDALHECGSSQVDFYKLTHSWISPYV